MQLSGWVALYEILPHGNPEHDVYMPKYYGHCKKVITVILNVSYSECGLEGSENKKNRFWNLLTLPLLDTLFKKVLEDSIRI